jgi:tetratricopeptide (TPR) repeat protein
MNRGFITAAAVLTAGAVGCVSTIPIRSTTPALVNLGPIRTLAILSGEGRRSARETVFSNLAAQARSAGYFAVYDRSEEGAVVQVAGRTVVLGGTPVVMPPDAAGLRIDVLGWDTSRDTNTTTDARGRAITTVVTNARAVLAITVFDASGRAFVAEKEYVGAAQSSNPNDSDDYLLGQAGAQAVARFLGDITPQETTRYVQLDDSEEALKPIIETAQRGNMGQAEIDFRTYLGTNPNSAAAAYDLAVVLDAMGRYQEAMGWYDRALQVGNQDFYARARADCAARMQGAAALQGW